jgi:methionine sulfoxide reductase heme-binding subunit
VALLAWAVLAAAPAVRIRQLSMTSAYASLVLLVASLAVGPVNVLRGHPNPVSTDLRRDIGIWCGMLALVHTFFGLQVHMAGRFWLYFVYPLEETQRLTLRHDLFGLANHTGAIATLLFVLLLALSNDAALRRLGTRRWKLLQRASYVGFAFIVLHGVAYQWIERRAVPLILVFAALCVGALVLQLAGFRRVRVAAGRGGEAGGRGILDAEDDRPGEPGPTKQRA